MNPGHPPAKSSHDRQHQWQIHLKQAYKPFSQKNGKWKLLDLKLKAKNHICIVPIVSFDNEVIGGVQTRAI